MRRILHLVIDGVTYVAMRADDTPNPDRADLQHMGGAPPAEIKTDMETPMTDNSEHPAFTEETPERVIKYIPPAFTAPLLLSGCERIPFLLMLGAVVFVTVVLFGITIIGLPCGVALFLLCRYKLREIAEYDPYFFAMWWESRKYPKHMPASEWYGAGDCAFIGYDDPPKWYHVLWAWCVVIGIGLAILAVLGMIAMVGWLFFFA